MNKIIGSTLSVLIIVFFAAQHVHAETIDTYIPFMGSCVTVDETNHITGLDDLSGEVWPAGIYRIRAGEVFYKRLPPAKKIDWKALIETHEAERSILRSI